MSMTDFIPFETSINLNLQYGDTTSRSCEGDRTYTDVYQLKDPEFVRASLYNEFWDGGA